MLSKNLAIIPARSGSKRIPKKNIKTFLGKPIIAYAIDACFKSELFQEVMVSTESSEVADVSTGYGAKVPFLRTENTSGDFSTTYEVLEEVVEKYKELGLEWDNICCVYPCVPFLTERDLLEAYSKFILKNADSLMPVVRYSHPIQRALQVIDSKLHYFMPEFRNTRSQDIEPMFHDVGMFYFVKTNKLLEEKSLFCINNTFYEMDARTVQDIDNLSDWETAELKYKIMKGMEGAINE